MNYKKILLIGFLLFLLLNKTFTQTFYIENKSNKNYLAVEAEIVEIVKINGEFLKLQSDTTALKIIEPKKSIQIKSTFYMPIYGELRGKKIIKKIKSINVYSCNVYKITNYFDTEYKLNINKQIITIENTEQIPSIKYHHSKTEIPFYESFPISCSYEN